MLCCSYSSFLPTPTFCKYQVKLEAVDDEVAEMEPQDPPKKEMTPENLMLSASLAGDTSTVPQLVQPKRYTISVQRHMLTELVLSSCDFTRGLPQVQTLISSGVKVNAKGEKDYTALHNATRNGHTALVCTVSTSYPMWGRDDSCPACACGL